MKKNKVILLIAIAVIIIAIFPYARTEFLTIKHGDEFKDLEEQTNMLSNSKYYKVFSYSDVKAEVFYVSDTGDMLTFVKSGNGNWELYEWKTVWSTSGSASDFIWPYYR